MDDFEFVSDAGKNILGGEDDAQAIKEEIEDSFEELPIDGLYIEVNVEEEIVILAGIAKDFDTREKAILIAGNVEGISKVNADQLVTIEMINDDEDSVQIQVPKEIFYTIQKGDTLWAIATKHYGNGSKYKYIVESNLEVIKNSDLIYAGQTIRIPKLKD
jgi:nucleoid-associated protein YgaU